ncbi:MAG: TAXI family TRAP transporter solute-binding subunit [Desulfitobacteriia bacterium]|jgi:TRAP transporter TAXI family solute receptor
MRIKKIISLSLILMLILTFIVGCSSATQQSTNTTKGLPEMLTWVSYEVGSAGYTQSAAIANALTKQYGTKIRIIPGDTSIGRVIALTSKQATYGFFADETSFAVQGLYDFASNSFGPQDLRVVLAKPSAFTFCVTADSGIKTVEDLKGKRVYRVPGNTSHTVKTEGFLAFGGLTWDDVVITDMPSFSAGLKGLAEGKVDVVCSVPSAAGLYEVASSPKGLNFIEFPASNTEGWKRLQKICPWIGPGKDNRGPGIDRDMEFPIYSYPQIVTNSDTSEEDVYQLIKAIDETFGLYKDANADMGDWAIEKASAFPVGAPYHEGAIKYLKEKGLWTENHEKWNNELIARLDKLKEAWVTVTNEALEKGIPAADFPKYWADRKEQLVP